VISECADGASRYVIRLAIATQSRWR